MVKWIVIYAIKRVVEFDADNINTVAEMAKQEKHPREYIVSVRIKR